MHVCAELPGDDVATVIIQNCAEVIPTPTDDFEVGKICLPHLVDSGGFIVKLLGCFNHHVVCCL